MASTWLSACRVSRHLCRVCRSAVVSNSRMFPKRPLGRGLLLSAAAMGMKEGNEVKLEAPDPSTLTSTYLIRKASSATVDAGSTLLTQTAIALAQAEKEYIEAASALVLLMEYRLQVLGNAAEETRIMDLVLQARALVTQTRQKKQNLEMIMTSAASLLTSATQVAYMTGEDISGSSAAERLTQTEEFLKQAKRGSEDIDVKLRAVEAKSVEIEAKHAEDEEKKKVKEKQEAKQK